MSNRAIVLKKWLVALLCIVFALSGTICLFSGCAEKEKTVVDVQMIMSPVKTEYIEGEKFDPTGMMLTAVYDDGTRSPITDYTIDKTGPLTLDDTEVTISYGDKSFTQPITVITAAEKVVVRFTVGVDQVELYADGSLMVIGNMGLHGLSDDDDSWWSWDGETLEIWITPSYGFSSYGDHPEKVDLMYDSQNNITFVYTLWGAYKNTYFVSYQDWSKVLTPDARYPIQL